MDNVFRSVFVALAFLTAPLSSHAASFAADEIGVSVTLSGPIVPGDAERLAEKFMAVRPVRLSASTTYYAYPNTLYLNSPGGDVREAIRLAELVTALGLTVAVAPNGAGACASSCFLIYVAAVERQAAGADTIRVEGTKGNLGPLGVHRPYLRDIANGPSGAREQEEVMIAIRAHLAKFSVGHSLIDKMMSHASNDIYWLNSEDVRSLGSFSPGVEEQLIAKCGYNAKRESRLSAREYIESSKTGAVRCVTTYMTEMYDPLKRTVVDRLRQGWRPWK